MLQRRQAATCQRTGPGAIGLRPAAFQLCVVWSQSGDCRSAAVGFMLDSHAMQKQEC